MTTQELASIIQGYYLFNQLILPKVKVDTTKPSQWALKDKDKYKIVKSSLPAPGSYNPNYLSNDFDSIMKQEKKITT